MTPHDGQRRVGIAAMRNVTPRSGLGSGRIERGLYRSLYVTLRSKVALAFFIIKKGSHDTSTTDALLSWIIRNVFPALLENHTPVPGRPGGLLCEYAGS